VYAYPWDVVGDPAAADRIAGLGADRAVLAAAYHTVRALTPLHPAHKVVTADHSAVYYEPDGARWMHHAVQPATAAWAPGSFHQAAHALRNAGVGVYAWVVLTHNQRLGTLHPELAVVNAFGDHYPWALCAANLLVRNYCSTLAAEVAALPEVDGLELESCGWYGFEHLHAHDKTGGSALPQEARALLSLCFCDTCEAEYTDAGMAPQKLRDRARAALGPLLAGDASAADATHGAVGAELGAVYAVRARAADRLRAQVLAAVRAQRADLPVLLHCHPDPRRVGANPGAEPTALFAERAGAVLQCWGPPQESQDIVRAVASQASGVPVAASLLAVAGLGGRIDRLADQAAALRAAGADELRLYHAGLATGRDLRAMRDAAAAWAAM
jgi:hypothetical protein